MTSGSSELSSTVEFDSIVVELDSMEESRSVEASCCSIRQKAHTVSSGQACTSQVTWQISHNGGS